VTTGAQEYVPQTEVGTVMVQRGLITEAQCEWALGVHQRTGSPLEAILVASGLVRRQQLYPVLADIWGHPYIDLTAHPLDESLLAGLDADVLVRQGWVPVQRMEDGAVLVASPSAPSAARLATITRIVGAPVELAITTDWDIRYALQHTLREVVLDRAALGLWRRSEAQSARRNLFRRQQLTLQVAAVVVGLAFLVSVLFKFTVCMAGAAREQLEAVTAADLRDLADDELPTYTVLVPVFREANVIGDLMGNLAKLDYPVDKLEILLLLEEGDNETIAAAEAAESLPTLTMIIVPKGQPQTKPKACNVGLFFARGDYLVIYDAEDRPEPDQLKKALLVFRRGDERLVCVQAALNYWNVSENVLTRMFTLEYSFWFDYMLPGLDALRLPIPLGGTSNHFRTDELRRLGGWDPFNVTEDADLGIRAAALGLTVGVVNSTTFEEANRATGNFIRQRSRWIKGYLQTVLVHTRRPIAFAKATGLRQVAGFLLLVAGTPVTFLLAPPLWAIFIASLVYPSPLYSVFFPGWVLWLSLFNLIVGNGLMIYVCMMGAFKRRRYELVLWALLNPVYWVLHSIAAYKALWQLITRPHYWEKTAHGISRVGAPAAAQRPAETGG
jgi:cellulose synthase/poly-beta-1,6-N-acetylglucosamine synthase-like glycosyltransferase